MEINGCGGLQIFNNFPENQWAGDIDFQFFHWKSMGWGIDFHNFLEIIGWGPLIFHNFPENQWAGAIDFPQFS